MRAPALAFAALVASLLSADAQAQATYTVGQYMSARMAIAPTCAPSGRDVGFLTDITGTLQAWRISAEGGWPDQLTFFPSGVSDGPYWSPKGNQLLITADSDGDQQTQLYLVRSDGHGLRPLTANGKVRHLLGGWSHDGKSVFFSSNERDSRYYDCYLLDVATGRKRCIFRKNAVLGAKAISPDGRLLAAVETHSEVNSDVYLVDVATGRGRLLSRHTADVRYEVIGFSSDSRRLFVTSDKGREFVNLACFDLPSGRFSFLRTERADVSSGMLSPDGRMLVCTRNRDGYQDLALYETATLRPIALPRLPHGIASPGGFSADGRRLVITFNGSAIIDDLWVIYLRSGHPTQITHSSSGGVDRASLIDPALVHYRSFDGRMIPAFLYIPHGATASHPAPVILSVHGGPEIQEQPFYYAYYQYFLSRGYAVLTPNVRGSSGYGKRYLTLDNGPKRWDALKDIAAAADWIKTQPALDHQRVAIQGASYGGFCVLAMLAHYPRLFAAGVDFYGPADLKSFLANTAPYRRPNRIAEYGDPVRDSAFMDAISPLQHAGNIRVPLLVVQGSNDPIVPPSESRKIVAATKSAGVPAEYIEIPGEGHGFAKLANKIRAFEETILFLDRVMKR